MREISRKSKVLLAGSGAHLIQDGLVALQYVLLPILAQAFGLNYTQVGLLRAISHTAMMGLELPSSLLARSLGNLQLLVFGLVCAGGGYVFVSQADDFYTIAFCFLITGIGAAFQHSISSAMISDAFDPIQRRKALGSYNAAGDAGKLCFTGLFGVLTGLSMSWQLVIFILGMISVLFAVLLIGLVGKSVSQPSDLRFVNNQNKKKFLVLHSPLRFYGLMMTVFLDSVIQAVFLTFIAFWVVEKGGDHTTAAISVVLALSGGMIGKFSCGFLSAKLGDRNSYFLLQFLTALSIVAIILLPLYPILVVLPIVGLFIQGTSTVTYGSVGDFVDKNSTARAYGVIYTVSALSSVIGPFLYGIMADYFGLDLALWVLVGLALVAIPPGLSLNK